MPSPTERAPRRPTEYPGRAPRGPEPSAVVFKLPDAALPLTASDAERNALADQWSKLLRSREHAAIRSVRPALAMPAEQLTELMLRARRLTPAYAGRAPNLHTWLRAELASPREARALVARLRRRKQVEYAAILAPPAPDPSVVPPCTFLPREQSWRAPAPSGLGVDELPNPTALGGGVAFADVEAGWWLEDDVLPHCDLPQEPCFVEHSQPDRAPHGTAVLGLVLARHQTPAQGVRGLAPAAGPVHLQGTYRGTGYDVPTAIAAAAAKLTFGDVLLIEVQVPHGPQSRYVPVEVELLSFQAIELAVRAGVVVVEAAGNSGVDLDTLTVPAGSSVYPLAPHHSTFRDSGAILVGAGFKEGDWKAKTHQDGSRKVNASSNHGARVDCFAQGHDLYTTSLRVSVLGGLNADVTAGFSDTSGASAILAGAALAVQGIARARPAPLDTPLTPAQLRELLRTVGTPSVPRSTPTTGRIGVMPNLKAIHDHLVGVQAAPQPLRQDAETPGRFTATWTLRGDPDEGITRSVQVEHALPPGTTLTLTLPEPLVLAFELSGPTEPDGSQRWIPQLHGAVETLGTGTLPAGLEVGLGVEVQLPADLDVDPVGTLTLRITALGLTLEQVTWRLPTAT